MKREFILSLYFTFQIQNSDSWAVFDGCKLQVSTWMPEKSLAQRIRLVTLPWTTVSFRIHVLVQKSVSTTESAACTKGKSLVIVGLRDTLESIAISVRLEIKIAIEWNNGLMQYYFLAIFKRTCEELALLGYTESGVYKIDIDGNGPFSPAHVKCKFETDSSDRETKTIVEHNLANETDIWNPSGETPADFRMHLTYREFSPDMLMSLISQSVQCSQHIKYDCYKSQLSLQQYSWFRSADPKSASVVSVGDADRNTCPCYSSKQY